MAEGATGHDCDSGEGSSACSGLGSGADTALSRVPDGPEATGQISAEPEEVGSTFILPSSIFDSMPAPPSLDKDSLGLASLLLS